MPSFLILTVNLPFNIISRKDQGFTQRRQDFMPRRNCSYFLMAISSARSKEIQVTFAFAFFFAPWREILASLREKIKNQTNPFHIILRK
jgi:hypothetical protein